MKQQWLINWFLEPNLLHLKVTLNPVLSSMCSKWNILIQATKMKNKVFLQLSLTSIKIINPLVNLCAIVWFYKLNTFK